VVPHSHGGTRNPIWLLLRPDIIKRGNPTKNTRRKREDASRKQSKKKPKKNKK